MEKHIFLLEKQMKITSAHILGTKLGTQLDTLMGKTFFTWSHGASEIFQFWNIDFSVLVHLSK